LNAQYEQILRKNNHLNTNTAFDNFISEKYLEAQEKSINYLNSLRNQQVALGSSLNRRASTKRPEFCSSITAIEKHQQKPLSPKYQDLVFNRQPEKKFRPYEVRTGNFTKSLTSNSGYSQEKKKRCLNTE